ncbi:MAG: twin-arginine translocation signal domain-containing protein, partial [Magnetococcales bacterium]|nr:twin-arginine translocation signal domain-containing protein [Magnetococcales bacterium]
MSNIVSRRNFLKVAATTGLGVLMDPVDLFAQYRSLTPVVVENPLKAYPNRDWEQLYRNIFKHDSTFVFMCCPNDTHNC